MQNRISKILREERMTAAKLAEEIGVQASGISHILSGRNKPSADFLIKILERFRGINAEWLMTGKGEMYKTHNNSLSVDNSNSINPVNTDLFTAAIANTDKNSSLDSSNSDKSANIDDTTSAKTLDSGKEGASFVSEVKTDTTIQQTTVTDKSKTVDKIVIFYTDNTFQSYNPR